MLPNLDERKNSRGAVNPVPLLSAGFRLGIRTTNRRKCRLRKRAGCRGGKKNNDARQKSHSPYAGTQWTVDMSGGRRSNNSKRTPDKTNDQGRRCVRPHGASGPSLCAAPGTWDRSAPHSLAVIRHDVGPSGRIRRVASLQNNKGSAYLSSRPRLNTNVHARINTVLIKLKPFV